MKDFCLGLEDFFIVKDFFQWWYSIVKSTTPVEGFGKPINEIVKFSFLFLKSIEQKKFPANNRCQTANNDLAQIICIVTLLLIHICNRFIFGLTN